MAIKKKENWSKSHLIGSLIEVVVQFLCIVDNHVWSIQCFFLSNTRQYNYNQWSNDISDRYKMNDCI